MPGPRGRRRRLRVSGRRHPARLRRDARLPDPSRAGAPRAGRRPHGRRLRPGHRAGRGGDGHLGPGRHQPDHRHRHRDDGLLPTVFITGQVPSASSWAPTPSRRPTSPASPCPSPSTTRWSPNPEDVAATVQEAFGVARTGRPGPVLVDLCKDALQRSCEFEWPRRTRRSATDPPAARPGRPRPRAGAHRTPPSGR